MMPFILAAAVAVSAQFKAVVVIDDKPVLYNQDQGQDVKIALPTNKYQCVRKAVEDDGGAMTVMISCEQKGKPVVVLGARCNFAEPDQQESVMTLNIGDKTVQSVIFVVACQTRPSPGVSL